MSSLASFLCHDRALVIGALTVVVLMAWAYMLAGAGMRMDTGAISMPMAWDPGTAGISDVVDHDGGDNADTRSSIG
jgi:predicted metal-binding membrane protein